MMNFTSITSYHNELLFGNITCEQTVTYYLDQIALKKQLNCFIEVFTDEAIERARQLDHKRLSGKQTGRLHGVVIGIKDNICYRDHRVSAGSRMLRDFISQFSATAVERLLNEDAIIIGRQNCDEFAMGSSNETSFYGNVLNPVDESKVPGGSSGGSATAVKAGLCMLSLGSDTGGSIRQPADFCGIIGLKPGYGLVSRHGLVAYASSFDQLGILATNIDDTALVLDIISGPDDFDSTAAVKKVNIDLSTGLDRKYRFAWFPETLDHPGIDQEISGSIRSVIAQLETGGHKVGGLDFDLLEYIVPAYYVLTTSEASSNLSRYDGVKYGYRSNNARTLQEMYCQTRSEGFGKEVKRRIMLGNFVLSSGYYEAYFTRAQQVRQLLWSRIRSVFEDYDFIIMPVSPFTAFSTGSKINDPIAMYLADIYTVMANLTGCPAISLPLFKHSNGLPYGLQLMSNRFDEVSLLKVSTLLINEHTTWNEK
jgi:aspartyl-tRNA(Asn)/glutamyl-tRNA(Gln) amidotransferase subunit A